MRPWDRIHGKCRKCGHVFLVAYLPQNIPQVVRLLRRAACPRCAFTRIYTTDEDLTRVPRPRRRLRT
jgi:hypothetical protein